MVESLEVIKTSRKQVKQKCENKCQQIEVIAEEVGDLEIENEDELVQWLRHARDEIKIKGGDAQ